MSSCTTQTDATLGVRLDRASIRRARSEIAGGRSVRSRLDEPFRLVAGSGSAKCDDHLVIMEKHRWIPRPNTTTALRLPPQGRLIPSLPSSADSQGIAATAITLAATGGRIREDVAASLSRTMAAFICWEASSSVSSGLGVDKLRCAPDRSRGSTSV